MKTNDRLPIAMATLLMLATTAAAGCATTRTAGTQFDDAMITSRVGHRLTMDPEVPRHDIDVDTLDGEVTLRGEVEDHTARVEAVEVASRTRGVEQVHDRILVKPAKNSKPDGDLGITTRVNNRLISDPEVKAANVDIDTYDGVVTLSGIVESDNARREAEVLALEAKGVKAVINELQVAEAGTMARR